MNKSRFSTALLVFLFIAQALVSQQNRSKDLERKLISDGYVVTKQLLTGSLSADFPYNLVISLPSTLENPIHRLFILISQDDAESYYAQVKDLISTFINSPSPYPVDILLSANDTTSHPALSNSLSGITSYIQNLDSVLNTTAIELQFSKEKQSHDILLQTGTKGHVNHSKITISILESLESYSLTHTIIGRYNSLYRMGFVTVSPVLSYILLHEIPAFTMIISPESFSTVSKALSAFTKTPPPANLENWDNNYTLLQFADKRFVISENLLMNVIIIVSGVSLFFLCSFSFLVGKTTHLRKEELSRTWYLLPIIIGITGIFLFFSQKLTMLIFPSWQQNSLTALILKLAIGLVFLSFVSLGQYLFSFPLTSFIYGYLLLIVSFINVFIFTTADISLFIPFSIEYILVYATRTVKRKRGIVTAAILMIIPFAPYILFLDQETRNNLLLRAVQTDFLGNILFACAAVPFEIMWIRIMVRMKLFGKQKGVSLKQILVELGGTALIVIMIALTVGIVRSKSSIEYKNKAQNTIIQSSSNSYVTATTERSTLFNKANTIVTFSTTLPVLRYNILIKSQSLLPIYDANYPYDSLKQEGTAVFTLDDFPPNPLVLRFSSPSDYDTELLVTAYLQHGTIVIAETKSIVFEKEN